MGASDKKLSAIVATAAFFNEFFGIVAHAYDGGNYPWFYDGMPKIFIDTIAVIAAGTVATMHTLKREPDIWTAVVDSAIPIVLAFMVPSLAMPSIVEWAHGMANNRRMSNFKNTFAIVVGVVVVLFLSSAENSLANWEQRTEERQLSINEDENEEHSTHELNKAWVLSGLGLFVIFCAIIHKPVRHHDSGSSTSDTSAPKWTVGVHFVIMLIITAILLSIAFLWNLLPSIEFHRWASVGLGSVVFLIFVSILSRKIRNYLTRKNKQPSTLLSVTSSDEDETCMEHSVFRSSWS